MAHDVFISYSTKDKSVVEQLCSYLETNNIMCWMAPRNVKPGVSYGEALISAISSSRYMVLVLSDNANKSNHVLREVERAAAKGIDIITFRIDNIDPSPAMEYFISQTHWLDAFNKPNEKHYNELVDTLAYLLGRNLNNETSHVQETPQPGSEVNRLIRWISPNRNKYIIAMVLFVLILTVGVYSWVSQYADDKIIEAGHSSSKAEEKSSSSEKQKITENSNLLPEKLAPASLDGNDRADLPAQNTKAAESKGKTNSVSNVASTEDAAVLQPKTESPAVSTTDGSQPLMEAEDVPANLTGVKLQIYRLLAGCKYSGDSIGEFRNQFTSQFTGKVNITITTSTQGSSTQVKTAGRPSIMGSEIDTTITVVPFHEIIDFNKERITNLLLTASDVQISGDTATLKGITIPDTLKMVINSTSHPNVRFKYDQGYLSLNVKVNDQQVTSITDIYLKVPVVNRYGETYPVEFWGTMTY